MGVGVSNVRVSDGETSVSAGSSVCVGGGPTSNGVERTGVDGGKSVGVSVEGVENVRVLR